MTRSEKRSAARLCAVQALYQMEMTAKGLNEVLAEFKNFWIGCEIDGDHYKPAEEALFRAILTGVIEVQIEIDRRVDGLLSGWPLKRIEAIMRAILRAAAYELLYKKDVPVRVVLSEYVDIASAFLERDEVGMINAVLDTLARDARRDEVAQRNAAAQPEANTSAKQNHKS